MRYEPTTFDLCISGMERMRSQSEFILLAYVAPSTSAKAIRKQWIVDMNSCDRFDGFDYDACRVAIDEALASWVRPAFRRKRWNPWGLERQKQDDEGCIAFLYIRVPETDDGESE